MAGASLLTLLDDIATVLDDVAVLTKVAAKKTAGVLGDDLALTAEQVRGIRAERELPVVWAVAKGSAINKAILVPAALAISALAPWAILPLLMAGGLYLCYEGFEKLAHKFMPADETELAHRTEVVQALAEPSVDLVALERTRIKGAVRTDFILSAEIIVIALGIIAAAPFVTQVSALVTIAVLMTVGVYGLVAAIVKLDDLGLYLARDARAAALQAIGHAILRAAPFLMKGLSIAGTAAMFLVGGGILVHGFPHLESGLHKLTEGYGATLDLLAALAFDAVAGIVAGGITLAVVHTLRRLRNKRKKDT